MDYFKKSEAIIAKRNTSLSPEDQAISFYRYACFADQQLQHVTGEASEIARLETAQRRLTEEIKILDNQRSTESSTQKRRQELHTDRDIDIALIESHKSRRDRLVRIALCMYARAIAITDTFDDSVTRMCALWLEYCEDSNLYAEYAPLIARVPSHKFLFLAHQLCSRLDLEPNPSGFQSTLEELIVRMCCDHPFHILYEIINIAHPALKSTTSTSRRLSTSTGSTREQAAIRVMERVRSEASTQTTLKLMETFVHAAIAWCKVDPPEDGKYLRKDYAMSSKEKLASLQNIPVAVFSAKIPIDLTKRYENIVSISYYEKKYRVAGGIHHPKIMVCQGSDGLRYKQLVSPLRYLICCGTKRSIESSIKRNCNPYLQFKAEDDLRQDTVMEQVFELINKLLKKDKATRDRELHFRTYKVLPMTDLTGIIEFVGNTIALGDWLNPAHKR